MSEADTPSFSRRLTELRPTVSSWRREGHSIGFVPTMGALHEGHLSLVEKAREHADRVVVSIFVNPTQFAPHEDLESYPRQERDDIEKLEKIGVDHVYLPDRREVYPDGHATEVEVKALGEPLCGVARPHFFGGVATVVCILLNQVTPDIAVFGEKDFQQLLVIKRMVRDLNLPVEILSGPTMRDENGLALSSRNAYLTPEERERAGAINSTLREMAARLSNGEAIESVLAFGRDSFDLAGLESIDYLEIRHADDLSPLTLGHIERPVRVFAAVNVGKARLIDNWGATPKAL